MPVYPGAATRFDNCPPYWTSRFTQDEIEQLTHDLGNLCLTHSNSSYGNKPFPAKRGNAAQTTPCYANAQLQAERQLAIYDNWGPAELLDRRQKVITWALKRWSLPVELKAAEPTSLEPDDELLSEETV